MRWLIVGCNGQLGTDLMTLLAGEAVIGLDYPDIDITDMESVQRAISTADPQIVINAAAYTAVDAAEEDEATALAVNGRGPEILAQTLAERDHGRLIHLSTDYVFSGTDDQPYVEEAPPGPQSAYGRTKLAGEQAVRTILPDRSQIVRTAWLYGENGNNFVKTMIRLESERETVSVVDDQMGQPTWSRDLAAQLLRLAEKDTPAGIYHGTNAGRCSWFEFTREIFSLVGADPQRVLPTTTAAFPRPAPRPAFSVLGHGSWRKADIPPMRNWREAAAVAVPRIAAGMTADS
jgi:dTDP-4-dehydrorhamnose reductase